ncbi:MAG TPA: glucose-6-phosphate isomerase, partial [Thermohalobaculum sp.]|nr:glucose-6-phosphate isomerase [Thermohalobaculum sp.]
MELTKAWDAVHAHAARLKPVHLRDLFVADGGRFARLSVALEDLTLDFSKEKLDPQALGALLDLAQAAGVEAKREAMFSGEAWNLTEGRAVLHMALRGGAEAPAGDDVAGMLDRFLAFAEAVRGGAFAPP